METHLIYNNQSLFEMIYSLEHNFSSEQIIEHSDTRYIIFCSLLDNAINLFNPRLLNMIDYILWTDKIIFVCFLFRRNNFTYFFIYLTYSTLIQLSGINLLNYSYYLPKLFFFKFRNSCYYTIRNTFWLCSHFIY